MEATSPQSPPEITISTSPRSASFFDRVLRRTSSGSNPAVASRIPQAATLNLPTPHHHHHHHHHNTSGSSRSSSRSSHKRAPLTIDTSAANTDGKMSNKKTKTSHLTIDTSSRSIPRPRSRNRPSRSPSPNIEAINHASRVASINHVGRHTNDWLFGGFHLTSKIGAPRGRSRT
ncbi:hypothetical protein AA313_de0207089 [Arthrobotrys entomopaga]|nr:hypothetical protein AA313_de0207089 [Arthrobotrys entomopaga]